MGTFHKLEFKSNASKNIKYDTNYILKNT